MRFTCDPVHMPVTEIGVALTWWHDERLSLAEASNVVQLFGLVRTIYCHTAVNIYFATAG